MERINILPLLINFFNDKIISNDPVTSFVRYMEEYCCFSDKLNYDISLIPEHKYGIYLNSSEYPIDYILKNNDKGIYFERADDYKEKIKFKEEIKNRCNNINLDNVSLEPQQAFLLDIIKNADQLICPENIYFKSPEILKIDSVDPEMDIFDYEILEEGIKEFEYIHENNKEELEKKYKTVLQERFNTEFYKNTDIKISKNDNTEKINGYFEFNSSNYKLEFTLNTPSRKKWYYFDFLETEEFLKIERWL